MDTDDTLVSYSVKKRIEEDEFVDIVGGNGGGGGHVGGGGTGEDVDSTAAQKLTSENYIHSSTTAIGSMSPEVNSSLKMSRFESKSRVISSMSNRNAAGGTDGQTISAPGGFSAWCGRVGPMNMFNQSSFGGHHGMNKTGGNSCASSGGVFRGSLVTSPTELTNSLGGALGFKTFNSELPTNMITDKLFGPTTAMTATATTTTTIEPKGSRTPGTGGGGGSGSTTGDGSAPCTPLAHLSLSPASLDMMPTRVIDYLDVHLCREAGEMLPLAVNDRLRHGRHFTFLNANYPDHAITLVPTGVSGAFVSEETPYVARGPWLQILLTDDFLEQLEFQFSCLLYPDELRLPLVFRWPERHLRICLIDVNSPTSSSVIPSGGCGGSNIPTNPLPSSSAMSSTLMNSNTPTTPPTTTTVSASVTPSHPQNHPHNIHSIVSKASNSPCNWNISSMFENKLLSTSGTPSSVMPQQQQQQQNAFTKTDLLFPSPSASSSLFSSSASLFPPGCIPPPNVLASLFSSSAASNMNSNSNNNSNSGSIHRSTNTTTSTASNIPSTNPGSNNNNRSESSQTELLRNPFLQSISSLQQTPLASTMPVPSPVHPQQPQSSSLPSSTDSGVMMKMDPTAFMNNWSTFLQTLMNNSSSSNADVFRQAMFTGHPSNPSAYFMEIMQSILNNSSSSSGSGSANNNSGTNPSVMLHHPLTAITSSGGGGGGGAGLPSATASSSLSVTRHF
ncbi:unnamed protein product [Trichobilharzia szidati]|nr:unnamed protein product [Trichobilharzia szidati]